MAAVTRICTGATRAVTTAAAGRQLLPANTAADQTGAAAPLARADTAVIAIAALPLETVAGTQAEAVAAVRGPMAAVVDRGVEVVAAVDTPAVVAAGVAATPEAVVAAITVVAVAAAITIAAVAAIGKGWTGITRAARGAALPFCPGNCLRKLAGQAAWLPGAVGLVRNSGGRSLLASNSPCRTPSESRSVA